MTSSVSALSELGGEPAAAGHTLVPREPMRAGLQLARYQRRAPEGADDRRCERDQDDPGEVARGPVNGPELGGGSGVERMTPLGYGARPR